MTDKRIIENELTTAFKAECKVIKLGYEYPGYTGTEKYAVISELSYEQIIEKYKSIVNRYIPFILLNEAAGEAIADFRRNEDKFYKRMRRDDVYGYEDGVTEVHNFESIVPDFTLSLFEDAQDESPVMAAFSHLTALQRKYVKQHLFGGKTFTQIAKEEGKAIKTVQGSYEAAIKKMKKFLETHSN